MTALARGLGLVATGALLATAFAAQAETWSFPVYQVKDGQKTEITYTPLEKAEKKWNICVLFPHMKDSFWVAVAYGVVEEAKRQGVQMTLLQAGGYENLPKQISQWDDCVAAGAQAIVTGAISEAGMAKKFQEGLDKGIPQISTVNPVGPTAPLTAKVFVEFDTMGYMTGEHLVKSGVTGKAVTFPGPQGSGWAEAFNDGFKKALEGSSIEVLDEKFGDTGVAVQQKLVEDALQAYPDMNIIWGTAPTAEAAIGAVEEAGLKDKMIIMSSYENQAMLDAMNNGDILGFATQWPVMEGRIAIDLAVRALEGKELIDYIYTKPVVITKETAGSIDMSAVLAPADWQPVYKVD